MTETASSPADSGDLLSLMLPSLCFKENEAEGLGFYGDQNLFRRIIRNPNPYGRLPKERECAEMLCGCLIHMPVFRNVLLNQMAEWVSQSVDFDDLTLKFSTEQPVLGKRDDLRVEGFDDEGEQKLLWTVEIKVGSGFHYSSRIDTLDESQNVEKAEISDDTEPDFVNQIENYDNWLDVQEIPNKAGFVLSIWNQKDNMPPELKNSWHCLTWREIARVLRAFIQESDKSDNIEIILCKNLLGFIEQALGGREMDENLQIEDVALFKSFYQQSSITSKRIGDIVSSVGRKFGPLSNLPYKPAFANQCFTSHNRCLFFWSLVDPSNGKYPFLCAGIVSDGGYDVIVYISVDPKHPKKAAIRTFLSEEYVFLQKKDSRWELFTEVPKKWWDLELRVPVEILLGRKDQTDWLYNHFQKAFNDLEAVGIIKGIQAIVT